MWPQRQRAAPLIEATRKSFADLESGEDVFAKTKMTAVSGFHGKAVLAAVEATGADAYVADRHYRKREPAFADAGRYKQREKKESALELRKQRETREQSDDRKFTIEDFTYDERNARCICTAEQRLYCSGKDMLFNGYRVSKFKAPIAGVPRLPTMRAVPPLPRPNTPTPSHFHQASRRTATPTARDSRWTGGSHATEIRHATRTRDL